MMRHEAVLTWLLKHAGVNNPDPLTQVMAYLVLAEGVSAEQAADPCPNVNWAMFVDAEDAVRAWAMTQSPAGALAFAASLPGAVAEEWLNALGNEVVALVRSLAERPAMAVRANRKRITREALLSRLEREGVSSRLGMLAPDALVLTQRANVEALPSFREGLFEVQDEGSQCLAELVPAFPGIKVVDFCAGAGGKSLALAASGAEVWALDVRSRGLEELERRAFRNGVRIRTDVIRDRGALPIAPGWADVVLVDAPCSGTGVIRRHPEFRYRLGAERLAQCAKDQLAILNRAADLVSYSGQKLVYGTCSLMRAENDDIVDAFLARRPMFRRGPMLGQEGWLWPHRGGTDGFYGVVLERAGL